MKNLHILFYMEKNMKYELNAEQKKAVESNDSAILCLAGAGTGKTRTLIERIVRLVNSSVDPKSILALTFTNAAAFEMKSRYCEYIPTGEAPEFRTFHSYCYDLMSNDKAICKSLGYSSMPKIADEKKEKRIESEAIMQSGVKLTQKKLADPSKLTMSEKRDLEILNKCKDRIMRKENLITFDALCYNICQLFIKNDPLVKKYRDNLKYLCVDEYQDTDTIQHDFVMSFKSTANIFLVADVLQSLYRFRGAVPEITKSLAMSSDWNVIKLTKNYRSTVDICDYANKFSSLYADDIYRVPIYSDRLGRPVETRTYNYSKDSQQHKDIYKRIAMECKMLSGSVAILSRTNAECSEVRNELEENDVAFTTSHKDIDARYLLPSILDSKTAISWLATFLPAEQYSEFIRIDTIQKENGREYTEQLFMYHFGTNIDIHTRYQSICSIRNIIHSDKPVYKKCDLILKEIGYPNMHVATFEEMSMEDLLSRIVENIEEKSDQDSSVYVGTIHSVKGLEYDTVYVIGVDGYKFRLNTEDNKNVYYVAITRARDNLVIYS